MYLSYYNAVQGKSSATVFSRLHPGEELSTCPSWKLWSPKAVQQNEMDSTIWPRKCWYGKYIYSLLYNICIYTYNDVKIVLKYIFC